MTRLLGPGEPVRLDLARRAIACRGWRWMPGMRETRSGERYEDGDGPWSINKLPDFTDPATLGCLLALVREAWEAPTLWPRWSPGRERWFVLPRDFYSPFGSKSYWGNTEVEALVLALEAAHVR